VFNLKITGIFKPGRLLKPLRSASAEIHTTAFSPHPGSRFKYFWSVENGRKAFGPTNASRRLRFFSRGKWWSPRSVAAAPAQRLRRQALIQAMPTVKAMAATWKGSIVDLVNAAAYRLAWALARVTPRRSGKLASSYTIKPAR